jgi:hypothetical protein
MPYVSYCLVCIFPLYYQVVLPIRRGVVQRLFIESLVFTSLIEAENDKELLGRVQQAVLTDLELPASKRDLIKGTGGFAKVRVADQKSGRGKSGGYRVIYFDLEDHERTFLFLIYPKSVKDTLTKAEINVLKTASQELKTWQPKQKSKK